MVRKSEQALRIQIGIPIIGPTMAELMILGWARWTKRLVDVGLVTVNTLAAVRK